MAQMTWNLESWLEEHKITRYELAKNMGGNEKSRLTTLYRMREPQRVDLNVMADIVSALRHITGEEVTPNDLLEFIPDPKPEEMDDETKAWLYAELTPPLEPWEWGPEGEPKGVPVQYVPGQGWLMPEDDA